MRRFVLDADLLVGWIGPTYDSTRPFFGIGEYYARGTRTPSDLSIYANSPNRRKQSWSWTFGWKPTLGTDDPANWSLEAGGDASTNSVLLGTFRTDVSFGKIIVVALPQVPGEPGAD
jgi:hypothetical protein